MFLVGIGLEPRAFRLCFIFQMSMNAHRPLLLRGNRFLGSALVNANLITIDHLEEANQKLLDIINTENLKQASILNILSFDMNVLDEPELIHYTVENNPVGLIDLSHYNLARGFDNTLDLPLCWATWTIPFERLDGIYSVATAYYLSKPIVEYWENALDGHIMWYACSLKSLSEALQRVDQLMIALENNTEAEAQPAEPAK